MDAWQATRRIQPTEESTPAAPPAHRRVWILAGVGLLVAAAVTIVANWNLRRDVAFHEHDWVLVDAFENLRDAQARFEKDEVDSPDRARRMLEVQFLSANEAAKRELEALLKWKGVIADARTALICGILEGADCGAGMADAMRSYGAVPFLKGAMALQQGRNAEAVSFFNKASRSGSERMACRMRMRQWA